ncbi:hypothetical protein GCM10027416_22670 [Okibacterium endophyticum]
MTAFPDAVARRSVEQLATASREELEALFHDLSAPKPDEFDGEFIGALPSYSNDEWRATMESMGQDFWLGKSYSPVEFDGHAGHGLNRFKRPDGTVVRDGRFVWDIAPSTIDGRPSLLMVYSHFPNWGGDVDLIDEVRSVGDNVYLGIYHTAEPVPGFTPRQGNGRSGIEFFILEGPIAPFVPVDE